MKLNEAQRIDIAFHTDPYLGDLHECTLHLWGPNCYEVKSSLVVMETLALLCKLPNVGFVYYL